MGADYQYFVQLVFQLPCRRRFNVVVAAYDLRHAWIKDALTQGVDPMTGNIVIHVFLRDHVDARVDDPGQRHA